MKMHLLILLSLLFLGFCSCKNEAAYSSTSNSNSQDKKDSLGIKDSQAEAEERLYNGDSIRKLSDNQKERLLVSILDSFERNNINMKLIPGVGGRKNDGVFTVPSGASDELVGYLAGLLSHDFIRKLYLTRWKGKGAWNINVILYDKYARNTNNGKSPHRFDSNEVRYTDSLYWNDYLKRRIYELYLF